jgi:hypothetical protein
MKKSQAIKEFFVSLTIQQKYPKIFIKKQAIMKYNFTFIRSIMAMMFSMCVIMGASVKEGWGQQTFYLMSSGNYFQNFSDIANWTNNYASGAGAGNWRTATSVATSPNTNNTVFVTGATGGVQRGAQTIVFLATGTNAGATDLLLNFSGRNAGVLSFDYEKIANTVNDENPRSSDLKIQYSLDNGLAFLDLSGYTWPRINNNSTAESGSIEIVLPAALNNQSQVVLRFYFWNNGQTGGSGNRPKWSIDNVSITSTESPTPNLVTDINSLTDFNYIQGSGPSASQSFELSGGNLDGTNVTVTAPANFEVSMTEGGIYTSTLTLAAFDGTETDIWVRMSAGLTPGDYSGNVAIAGGGATAVNVAVEGTVLKPEPSNHVTDLLTSAGIPPYRAIDLSWTDATGGTEPDGYLVLASTTDNIANPVDGVAPAADLMTKYVQGVESVSFIDLAPSTLHYFKVFPYTNSGTDINYKTTDPVPMITATTGNLPTGYFVDFEGTGETKTGYDITNNTVNLNGIDWDLKQALIGTESSEFKFNNRSLRMRGYGTTLITMLEDKLYGAGRVSFYYSRYATDTQTPFIVEYSTDAGANWTQIGSAFTATENIQYFDEELNVAGNVRIRIGTETTAGTSNRRMNIDDISITNYFDGSPNIFVTPGSLDNFEYVESFGPSAIQSFSFSGIDLLEDVNLDVTGDFEIAQDIAGPFGGGPFVYSPVGGVITETLVYVRMVDGLTEDSYSGGVVLTTGATVSETVTLSGKVTTPLDIPYVNNFRNQGDIDDAIANYFTLSGTTLETGTGGYIRFPLNGFVETPMIDFSAYDALQVRFSVATYGTGTNRRLDMKVSNDNGSTYTVKHSAYPTSSTHSIQTVILDLTGVLNTNQGKIRFEMTEGTGQVWFRDLSITLVPVATPTFDPPAWTYLSPIDVDIETTTSGAEIYYSTTSASGPWVSYAASIPVSESTTIWAYGSKDGMADSEVAEAEYIIATLVPVNNIAELRDKFSAKSGPVVYEITGEVILTLQGNYRNHKYIQDATGAILIDDVAGTITTEYFLGDGITGITGELSVFQNMFQFVPIVDPGPRTSFGNVIVPEVITLNSLSSDDQAKLVKILSVSFNASGDFAGTTNYDITDPQPGTGVLRTHYEELAYVDEPIPQYPQHITGVILQYGSAFQLIPRDLGDFSNTIIASINHAGVVGVPFGTSESDALSIMPPTTTILDDGGASHVVALTWTHIENYDPDQMGNYQAFAIFDLPEGVDQSDPETDLVAQGTVAVAAPLPIARWAIYLAMAAMIITAVFLVRRRIAQV